MSINPLSGFGSTDNAAHVQSVMKEMSHHAAMGTGKADEHKAKEHPKEVEHEDDAISLSPQAEADAKEEAKKAAEEDKKTDRKSDDSHLQESRRRSVSGHAAQSLLKKKDLSGKEEAKHHKADTGGEGGDTLNDLEKTETNIEKADTTGVLDEEMKRHKTKSEDEKFVSEKDASVYIPHGPKGEEDPAQFRTVKPEMVEKILNRDPQEILKDIPPQFKATAQMMVGGQIDSAGKPKESLSQMKTEPRVECARLELMPAEEMPIMDISVENPPIPDLTESQMAT